MIYKAGEYNVQQLMQATEIQKRRRGNQAARAGFNYKDLICAFDIETSLIKTGEHLVNVSRRVIEDYVAAMYIWQMQLGLNVTIYGRTWDQFLKLMQLLTDALNPTERICIFVHNLAYEFQFLRDKGILGPVIDEASVFCVKPRTPVKFVAYGGKIEFRCSYIHSNMSLGEFTDKMHVEHGKLSGDEFDYTQTRYSWTDLTARQLEYCTNDVIGLVECIYKECEIDGDNLYTLPLTSTGYVRRDIKKVIQKLPHGYIGKQLPDYPTYRMLRKAFRGGNTHASRFVTGRRIDRPIKCMDFSSSYPYELINSKFPITPFREITTEGMSIQDIVRLIKKGRAVVCSLALYDIRLRNEFWPVPYLSRDKSENIVNAVYDNGRILSADYLEVTITDIDLMILLEEYEFTAEILDARFSSYGYLPEEIKNVVRDYFCRKTWLKLDEKNISVMTEEIANILVQYVKSKNKLNACFGLAAQCPVKLEEAYMDGDYVIGLHYGKNEDGSKNWISEEAAERAGIDIYELAHKENIEKSIMPYQWGVWVTAHAREHLEQAIRICWSTFLYCDTDSVYFYGDPDFTSMNEAAKAFSAKNGAYAEDREGTIHYMGVLELDKQITSFITYGAKKYAYIDRKGFHITIAGVSKKKGAAELEQYAAAQGLRDGMDALTEDFVFSDAGGTESVYNDSPCYLTVEGREIYVPSNVAIKPNTYKVGISRDYKDLLLFLLDHNLIDIYRKNFEGAQLPIVDI